MTKPFKYHIHQTFLIRGKRYEITGLIYRGRAIDTVELGDKSVSYEKFDKLEKTDK